MRGQGSFERSGQAVGAIGQVAGKDLVGAFSAQGHGGLGLAHAGEKPDRQRPGVGAGLIGVVGELLNRALQILLRVEVELFVIRSVLRYHLLDMLVSSKLRPRKEMEKVFKRLWLVPAA